MVEKKREVVPEYSLKKTSVAGRFSQSCVQPGRSVCPTFRKWWVLGVFLTAGLLFENASAYGFREPSATTCSAVFQPGKAPATFSRNSLRSRDFTFERTNPRGGGVAYIYIYIYTTKNTLHARASGIKGSKEYYIVRREMCKIYIYIYTSF